MLSSWKFPQVDSLFPPRAPSSSHQADMHTRHLLVRFPLLPTTYYLLPTTYNLLPIASSLLPTGASAPTSSQQTSKQDSTKFFRTAFPYCTCPWG